MVKSGLNTGYKSCDPSHTCKKVRLISVFSCRNLIHAPQCWRRYSFDFTGPLTNAHWDDSTGNSMQQPLPDPAISEESRALSLSPCVVSRGSYTKGMRPGDPRIGGALCWRCDGKGSLRSLRAWLFRTQRLECPVCAGLGRNFYDLIC